ncbi:MAG: glycosyltransferase family 2 protein [Lachnospiraceae bacterium]|nr:glycosyltransferase family 2 protein [Lachnospiraceae bacterium]
MNNPKVSIIMPVYKVEEYVGAAIESVLAQSFCDFEFLIVDDGSPDGSGAICDEYAARDGRIKVYHKENGGAPSARNYAMDRACGKYYYFMDSDDYAEPEMLADMVALAEENEAQLVVAGFFIDTYYSDDRFRRDTMNCGDAVFKDAASFRNAAHTFFDKNLLYTPWNKLWLRSYIEERGLRFPQTFWDDFPFVLSVIRDAESVVVTSKAYYHFIRKRAESETAAYRPEMYEKREEEHGWMQELYAHWGVDTPESREFLARRYIERFIGCLENLTNKSCTLSKKEVKEKIKEMLASPRVDEALSFARPRSRMMKLMLLPVRRKNVWLTYREAKTISFVKSRNTRVFAALKAGR